MTQRMLAELGTRCPLCVRLAMLIWSWNPGLGLAFDRRGKRLIPGGTKVSGVWNVAKVLLAHGILSKRRENDRERAPVRYFIPDLTLRLATGQLHSSRLSSRGEEVKGWRVIRERQAVLGLKGSGWW